jgi:hypothetical protein
MRGFTTPLLFSAEEEGVMARVLPPSPLPCVGANTGVYLFLF